MVRSDLYYRFIAPAKLAYRGLPITKENIKNEIKRLKMVDSGVIENNLLSYNMSYTNDIKQVFSNEVIYGLYNGDNAKIKYTVGESGVQEIECFVIEINGCRSLVDKNNYDERPTLVGDDMNNVKLYLYLNTMDLVNVNNGSVSFVETNGNYNDYMPIIKILSIEKA